MSDRRPWGSLERGRIVEAALGIARAEGLDALTIRRLATEVGASRMGLYRHVPDKEALLNLVADEIAMNHVIPDRALMGPWDERLRHLARGMRQELRAYPGFAERIMVHGNAGAGGLRIAETIADILAAAGLGVGQAARCYLIFVDLVLGRAHRETHGDPTTPGRNAELFAAAETSRDAVRLKALLPALRAVTGDEIFEAELDILIAAVRAAT
ncbi:TetR/AcrR family transcriptional regulator [Nocardia flavorosea]|uniref:TetR family transcriptional regulator n=1 Tax=Nocardia flavorosea TaxID=53429 RepID=A0A846YHX7_9NOCA|nr:TetR/AcrR family transcriptional regulator C-terminal domain-containing protein [Nocardia flavorosea]NKY59226.1 TetR family transcriptional regulator [Nocardia flavorosea]